MKIKIALVLLAFTFGACSAQDSNVRQDGSTLVFEDPPREVDFLSFGNRGCPIEQGGDTHGVVDYAYLSSQWREAKFHEIVGLVMSSITSGTIDVEEVRLHQDADVGVITTYDLGYLGHLSFSGADSFSGLDLFVEYENGAGNAVRSHIQMAENSRILSNHQTEFKPDGVQFEMTFVSCSSAYRSFGSRQPNTSDGQWTMVEDETILAEREIFEILEHHLGAEG